MRDEDTTVTAFRAATLLLLTGALWLSLALLAGCAARLPSVAPPPVPDPDTLLFTEATDPRLRLCVGASAGIDYPYTCMRLDDFRKLLHGRRFAHREEP